MDLPEVPKLKKPARPWDMLNPNTEYVSDEIQLKRMSICKKCPFYIKLTHQCTKCGCIMNLKTKLSHAECPIGKWGIEIPKESN